MNNEELKFYPHRNSHLVFSFEFARSVQSEEFKLEQFDSGWKDFLDYTKIRKGIGGSV